MEKTNKIYLCIDLKSFYASVECVERGLDPFEFMKFQKESNILLQNLGCIYILNFLQNYIQSF